MPEPLGVAFVEIEPVAAGFRAKTEAQLRSQLAGVGAIPPSPQTAAATKQVQSHTLASERAAAAHRTETAALEQKAVAAGGVAAAEGRAAAATTAHGTASRAAAANIAGQAGSMAGLGTAATGLNPPLLAAAAASVALFKSLGEADEFAEKMHLIETATHATAEEMDEARNAAFALGRDLSIPGTSAIESAEAINLLARSGFDLQESMTAARGSLLLAAASGETLNESVSQIDRVLDAFNLKAEDSVRIADAVAVGLKFTAGNAREFSQALFTLAPAADSIGLSLEQTNTLVLQLTESGLSASQAAGTLRQAFLKLAEDGKGVRDGLKSIGLETADLFDELGRLRPDAFVILAEAVDHLNNRQRLAVLTQIFTRRAALGVIRIIEQQREGYDRMSEAASRSGVAQEDAAARAQTAGGQLAELRNDLSDTGTAFGSLAQGPATLFIRKLRDIVQVAGAVSFGILVIADAVGELGRAAGEAVPGLNEAYEVMKKMVELQVSPTKGISALVGFISDIPDKIGDAATGLQQAIDMNVAGIADIPGIKELADNLGLLSGAWEKSRRDVKTQADGMADDVDKALKKQQSNIERAVPKIASASSQIALAIAQAQAAGDEGAEIRGLRQREAGLERFIARQEALPQTKARVQTLIKANQQLAQVRGQIEAILAGQEADAARAAADANAHADKIEQAAKDRDQAFIRALQAQVAGREGAVTAAAVDDTLANDIRANIKLRKFLTSAIEQTQTRIREARAAGRKTVELAAALAEFRRAKNAVRREIDALQREAAAQAASTRVESAQLDLQILEARVGTDPNASQTNKLVSAHQRVIKALKRAQSLTKKRSLEYKRLQLDIENELAAIRDLRKAAKEGREGADFGQLSFQFLQQQQGVLANFGPNFFPSGALTVGGRGTGAQGISRPHMPMPSPFDAPRTKAAAADALKQTGMTHGQANELVTQVRVLVHEIRLLRRGAGHPSNRHSEKWNKHLMDHGV